MHTLLAALLIGQTTVDPIGDAGKLTDLLQKGGLAAMAAIFVVVSTLLWRSRDKLADRMQAIQEANALELKLLNAAHSKALSDMADKARTDVEAKNTQIVGFVGKLVESMQGNTTALERLTEAVERFESKAGR